jgi:hypothetical protein
MLPDLAGGGAERVVTLLAAHFAKLGHPVDLLLGRVEGPYLKRFRIAFECGGSAARSGPETLRVSRSACV